MVQTLIFGRCDVVRSRAVGLTVEPQLMHSPSARMTSLRSFNGRGSSTKTLLNAPQEVWRLVAGSWGETFWTLVVRWARISVVELV